MRQLQVWKNLSEYLSSQKSFSTAAYAKSASNDFENGSGLLNGFAEIAEQLTTGRIGRNFNVILGGGYKDFLPNSTNHPHGLVGHRTDNRDLIREWLLSHQRSVIVHDKVTRLDF